MRRQERIRCGKQRRVCGWFVFEDVDARPGKVPRRKGLGDGGLVDDPAARDIEDDPARPELGDRLAPDQPPGRACQGDMHGHDVGAREHLVELHEFHAVVGRLLSRHERIHPQDEHLHRPCADRDGLTDLAQTDDADGPTAQFQASELGALPLTATDGGIGRRRSSRDAVQQGQRVFSGRDRVARRGVHDHDPGAGRGIEVHVIDADPGSPDHHKARRGRDQLGIHLDLTADDERVVARHDLAQLVVGQADPFIDLVMCPQQLDALAGDGFRDEDLHAVLAAAAVPMPSDPRAATCAAATAAPGRIARPASMETISRTLMAPRISSSVTDPR